MNDDLSDFEDRRNDADAVEAEASSADPPADAPKKRECLRCNTKFTSDWAGERICPRCKGSSAWKNGSPLRSGPSNGRVR
ncbi:MAG: hypothetical protein O3A96_11590 [Proteobacteria bacterium]|nr:hypothetical protein [Pseudomonadota bacterium]